jgi:hypothetical protein
MNERGRIFLAAAAAAGILFLSAEPTARAWHSFAQRPSQEYVAAVLAGWPEYSRMAAEVVRGEYGPPDGVSPDRLVWGRVGVWKRVVVYRSVGGTALDPGVLEETVDYAAPSAKWPDLAGFDHGVVYDPLGRELSARSASEESNFLALNLADEIVRDQRTPEDAMRFFDQTVALGYSGKSSPYLQGLLFRPASPRAEPRNWLRDRRW